MRIEPIVPDISSRPSTASAITAGREGAGFEQLLTSASRSLDAADAAESAFAHNRGGLQEMVVARARADITLAVAAAGTQRAAQALNTLLGMQI